MNEARFSGQIVDRPVGGKVPVRLLVVSATLVAMTLGASLAGKWVSKTMALAGHTTDQTIHRVLIGDNVILAPANTIRFDEQRRDGLSRRLDVYLSWPELDGYSDAAKDSFNHQDGSRDIIFMLFEERLMSRDMSARLEPVYESMLKLPGEAGPGGTTLFAFDQESGYLNERLAVAYRTDGQEAFVARCLSEPEARDSLASCERDIHLGNELSLTYRFPVKLLEQWERLDTAIRMKAVSMLAASN